MTRMSLCGSLFCVSIFVSPPTTSDTTAMASDASLNCPRCNVILLNIELLRADHVGLISGSGLTPNIDRFFQNGIIFHDVSAPAGETFLSNTAVLTLTPTHLIDIKGIQIDKLDKIDTRERNQIESYLRGLQSIAEVLGRRGYHTLGINQGGRAGRHVYLDRGFVDFSQWSSKVLFEDLVSLVIDKLDTRNALPRFILFRPTFLHPYQYRRPDVPQSLLNGEVRVGKYVYEAPDGKTKRGFLLKRRRDAGKETEKATDRSIYRAQLRYGDAQLSRIFQVLEDSYIRHSVIVLYANHGSGLGDNDIFRHGTSYQSSIHVPVLVRHPGVDHVIHIAEPVSLLDLVPSIYKMLDIEIDEPPLTVTFDDTITGSSFDERLLVGRNGWDEYVRLGDWKLIIEYDRVKSLFNLKNDPQEERDLYRIHRDKARQLESLLLDYKRKIYQYSVPFHGS